MEVRFKRAVGDPYEFVARKSDSNFSRVELNYFANRANGNVGRCVEANRIHDSLPDRKAFCLLHSAPAFPKQLVEVSLAHNCNQCFYDAIQMDLLMSYQPSLVEAETTIARTVNFVLN